MNLLYDVTRVVLTIYRRVEVVAESTSLANSASPASPGRLVSQPASPVPNLSSSTRGPLKGVDAPGKPRTKWVKIDEKRDGPTPGLLSQLSGSCFGERMLSEVVSAATLAISQTMPSNVPVVYPSELLCCEIAMSVKEDASPETLSRLGAEAGSPDPLALWREYLDKSITVTPYFEQEKPVDGNSPPPSTGKSGRERSVRSRPIGGPITAERVFVSMDGSEIKAGDASNPSRTYRFSMRVPLQIIDQQQPVPQHRRDASGGLDDLSHTPGSKSLMAGSMDSSTLRAQQQIYDPGVLARFRFSVFLTNPKDMPAIGKHLLGRIPKSVRLLPSLAISTNAVALPLGRVLLQALIENSTTEPFAVHEVVVDMTSTYEVTEHSNVYSNAHPGPDVRGQVEPTVAVPHSYASSPELDRLRCTVAVPLLAQTSPAILQPGEKHSFCFKLDLRSFVQPPRAITSEHSTKPAKPTDLKSRSFSPPPRGGPNIGNSPSARSETQTPPPAAHLAASADPLCCLFLQGKCRSATCLYSHVDDGQGCIHGSDCPLGHDHRMKLLWISDRHFQTSIVCKFLALQTGASTSQTEHVVWCSTPPEPAETAAATIRTSYNNTVSESGGLSLMNTAGSPTSAGPATARGAGTPLGTGRREPQFPGASPAPIQPNPRHSKTLSSQW